MIVVLLGAPGSGKGTQAKRLQTQKNLPHLSTGDMFRANISQGTPLGMEAKKFMDQGLLVPDSVTVGMLKDRISKPDCSSGFILDGFPRNVAQAGVLDEMLAGEGKKIDHAVMFEVPDDEVIRRLAGRRVCSKCGAIYHAEDSPPKNGSTCDKCGGPVIQRVDDQKDVIAKRVGVYWKETAPMVDFYRNSKRLKTVDATVNPDKVYSALEKALQ